MREIIFDTETTGFDPYPEDGNKQADRIVEIGAIEVVNLIPTGRTFHHYINPDRSIPESAIKIHGIDDERVKNCPTFHKIADKWLDFIGEDAKLVAHNAQFDMKFINAELLWAGKKSIDSGRFIDTLPMARQKFPGQKATLDSLCIRFDINNSGRTFHGALLDSQLLLDVYIELRGGRQHGLKLEQATEDISISTKGYVGQKRRESRHISAPSPEEEKAHDAFLASIKNPIWDM